MNLRFGMYLQRRCGENSTTIQDTLTAHRVMIVTHGPGVRLHKIITCWYVRTRTTTSKKGDFQ